jgi:Family of unknown function (DUF6328)
VDRASQRTSRGAARRPGAVAFLLAAPFSPLFGSVTDVQKNAYFLSLLFTTISAGLMTAPTTFHRLRWRHGDKEKMLEIMNRSPSQVAYSLLSQ